MSGTTAAAAAKKLKSSSALRRESNASDSLRSKKANKGSKPVSGKPDASASLPADDSCTIEVSNSQLPELKDLHRNKDSCPCNTSLGSWKLDCSQCGQWWHLECVGLKGLDEKAIKKLTEYRCPFCYVSPIPTISTAVDVCHICRNTLSLQQTNIEFESNLAQSKLQDMSKCCAQLEKINFEQFSNHIETLSQFDTRLQHLLLHENSLKGHNTDIISCDKSLDALNVKIGELQHDLKLLTSRPTPEPVHASESSENLLASISAQLTALRANEPHVTAGINELKQSISSIQSSQHPGPSITTTPSLAPPHETLLTTLPDQPTPHLPHDQVPVTDMKPDFIQSTESDKLTAFLQSCSFKSENGHSVVSFGEPYHYTGSKSSQNVPPIPEDLKPLFEEMNKVQTELYNKCYPEQPHLTAPIINSCLINRYDGPESHLPNHSDREVTIHPESSILTLSLGQSCNIKFTECDSGTESSFECPDRSLYIMSRRSQEVYSHMIERGSMSDGIRYSLTFRAVRWTNKNSTSLHGDSNTGLLRFGSDKRGTFGELMPGQKFWAPRIDDINPVSCMGYANVVLHCGINDVRQPDVKSENDIADCYNKLKLKIKQIKKLSPSTRTVFVCQLLPTRDLQLNFKVDSFNRLIHFDLLPKCKDVVRVKGFMKFACNQVLADELSKQFDKNGRPDTLHLNKSGARVLAGLIKQTVFTRLNGGVDRRHHIGKVNGRLYSSVASDSPAPQRRERNG